jgi:hypothetical protein
MLPTVVARRVRCLRCIRGPCHSLVGDFSRVFFCLPNIQAVVPEGGGVGDAVDGDHGGPGRAASWGLD